MISFFGLIHQLITQQIQAEAGQQSVCICSVIRCLSACMGGGFEAGLCAHSGWQHGAKFIAELIIRDMDLFHWSQMVTRSLQQPATPPDPQAKKESPNLHLKIITIIICHRQRNIKKMDNFWSSHKFDQVLHEHVASSSTPLFRYHHSSVCKLAENV